jgi:hypothetical protein
MLFKRILLGGIGLAIVLLAFLWLPLWLRNVDHPLSASAAVDVCSYLTDGVLVTLPRLPETVARGMPGDPDTSKPACRLLLPAAQRTAPAPNLWVAVTTERMLNGGGGRPQRTDRFVDTWLKESEASGSTVTPVKGPWRRAAVIRDGLHVGKLGVLADDAGVVVWVNSEGVDEPVLVAFSEAITRSLRGQPTPAGAR